MQLATVLAAAWLMLLWGTGNAQAALSVEYKCTPGPADCSGWSRSDVAIEWTVLPSTATRTGCQNTTYRNDTRGTQAFCSATDGTARVTAEVTIKLDKTVPVVTGGQPSRGADVNGWYNRAVGISFSGTDQTSGIDFCTATTYGGPDSGSASVTGTCHDKAGNQSNPLGYGLKYDQTAPVLSGAIPERAPNAGGWFNRPVRFDIQAGDAISGIADCPPVTYGGPDSAAASFTGSCRDRAGNPASRIFSLKYDATAPVLSELKATGGNRSVALSWRASADTESLEVMRAPGVGTDAPTAVFRGLAGGFMDGRVDNGVRYSYEVRAYDAAGNAAMQTAVGVPVATGSDAAPPGPTAKTPERRGVRPGRAKLLSPKSGALVRPGNPPRLEWTPVLGARYYNVQLWRNGRKVLSTWPARPRLQLKKQWKFDGRSWRFERGRYRWLVWPGFGARSKGDYGRRIGPSTFRVGNSRSR